MSNYILGIDPGSRITGYGIINAEKSGFTHVNSGCIKTTAKSFPERLQQIFTAVDEIVLLYKPKIAVVEQVFMHVNPSSALKLGQARGAAIVAIARHGVAVEEYSARQIKLAAVGYGAATKQQVQFMVKNLLKLKSTPAEDEADALAGAICQYEMQRKPFLKSAPVKRRRVSFYDYIRKRCPT